TVPAATLLEGSVAEAVIGSALLLVLEDVVRLVDFLEADFAFLVASVAVRMKLHRELAVRDLQLGIGRGPLNAQRFVVAALRRCHAHIFVGSIPAATNRSRAAVTASGVNSVACLTTIAS